MKILLDTNIIIRCVIEPGTVRPDVLNNLDQANLYYSFASLWEIVMLNNKRRLPIRRPIQDYVNSLANDLYALEILSTSEVLKVYESMEKHHRDPFDHMIIACAKAHNMPLITSDKIFRAYDTEIILTDFI